MQKISYNPTTNHRVQTGRFQQLKNKQEIKNQLILEKAIIKSTSSTSSSFSATPHLNKSAFVTGLLATMALSAVVLPCAQAAPVKENINTTEPKFAPEPLPPAAIRGGTAINGAEQSKCLVNVFEPTFSFERLGCTGTLIAPNVVLTAQHCVLDNKRNTPFKLNYINDAGTLQIHNVDGDLAKLPFLGNGQIVEAAYLADGFMANNEYIFGTPMDVATRYYGQDLAILKLKTPIECSPFYKLPTEDLIQKSQNECKPRGAGGQFTIRGNGDVNFPENSRYFAREAKVKCTHWWSTRGTTGGAYGLSNTNRDRTDGGDSGGPLTWHNNGTEYQVGVCHGYQLFSGQELNFYTSLKGRIATIQEIVGTGDTAKMLKIGCVKLHSHFSPFWQSSQRITLTNTCKQAERVILAMGKAGQGGIMVTGESEDLEHNKNKIILKPKQSLSYSIPKNKNPIFVLSKTATT